MYGWVRGPGAAASFCLRLVSNTGCTFRRRRASSYRCNFGTRRNSRGKAYKGLCTTPARQPVRVDQSTKLSNYPDANQRPVVSTVTVSDRELHIIYRLIEMIKCKLLNFYFFREINAVMNCNTRHTCAATPLSCHTRASRVRTHVAACVGRTSELCCSLSRDVHGILHRSRPGVLQVSPPLLLLRLWPATKRQTQWV